MIKIFFSTFLLIFLAELGDKTQLTALLLSAKEKKPLLIFAAAMSAFFVSTFLAVLLGSTLTKFFPETIIKKTAALVFIGVGLLILFNKI